MQESCKEAEEEGNGWIVMEGYGLIFSGTMNAYHDMKVS
jgi:hypothetical protein